MKLLEKKFKLPKQQTLMPQQVELLQKWEVKSMRLNGL